MSRFVTNALSKAAARNLAKQKPQKFTTVFVVKIHPYPH